MNPFTILAGTINENPPDKLVVTKFIRHTTLPVFDNKTLLDLKDNLS